MKNIDIKMRKKKQIELLKEDLKSKTKASRVEYISRLVFNNGESLSVEPGSIVVFVGPNNAGKSQALRDIYSCSKDDYSGIVISGLDLEKSQGLLSEKLESFPMIQMHKSSGYTDYYYLGTTMTMYPGDDDSFQNKKHFGRFIDFFIANLDTRNRLNICQPAENIDRHDPKKSPIQYAALNSKLRDWLSDCFRKAFNTGIIPNGLQGKWIPLCMGDSIVVEPSSDGQKVVDEYTKRLGSYPQIQNQGDGIKSFTGILLYLMLKNYAIYLIDEPEAFLHPPQAKVMGEIIGSSLGEAKQAFIATHSEEVIKGLLEVCPERVKIIRITREQDNNYTNFIDNNQFKDVWDDPLLKYSNIMSSLFYKSVVLCESDSDCKMYSIVLEYLKKQEDKYPETLFIHCNGKQRMARIAKALRTLGIFVKIIPDIDVLNDEAVFKALIESVNIDWSLVSKDYNILSSSINNKGKKPNRVDLRNTLIGIIDASKKDCISEDEIKALTHCLDFPSSWDLLKKAGSVAIPSGSAMTAYKHLVEVLQDAGIFVVEVGELECFVKEVGGHGPHWTNSVLEKYPDIGNPVYTKIREFVSSLDL